MLCHPLPSLPPVLVYVHHGPASLHPRTFVGVELDFTQKKSSPIHAVAKIERILLQVSETEPEFGSHN